MTYDQQFASSVEQLVAGNAGAHFVTGTTKPTVDDPDSGFIDSVDQSGHQQFRIKSTKRGAFAGIAPQKNGDFTVAEFVERPDFEFLYELDLVRFGSDGKEKKRTAFKSLAHDIFKIDGTCFLDSIPIFATKSAVTVLAVNDEDMIVLAYACFQHVLLRINANHEVAWSCRLTPPLASRTLYQSTLVVQEKETLKILLDLKDKDVALTESHLALAPSNADNTSFLVTVDATTGEIAQARVLASDANEQIHMLQFNSNTLYAIGTTSKANPSGRSKLQNDLLVKAINLSDLSLKWSRTFNFGNEQLPASAATTANGDLVVGGCFRHVVVDSGSWMAFPDGFLALFSSVDGALLGGSTVQTNRKDIVLSILTEGENVLFGGITDGPITHTADSDPSLGYAKGFVRTMPLRTLRVSKIN